MVSAGYLRLAALGPGWLVTAASCALIGWMMWYVYTAFRTVYHQAPGKTGVKILAIAISYCSVLVFMAGLLLIFTLAWLVYI